METAITGDYALVKVWYPAWRVAALCIMTVVRFNSVDTRIVECVSLGRYLYNKKRCRNNIYPISLCSSVFFNRSSSVKGRRSDELGVPLADFYEVCLA